MSLYKWSQAAANNATADPSVNWQEGQAPSSINDSARAMMASIAKHRDDIAGVITTGGSSSAYTVMSHQAFDSPAHMSGQMIAFTPHVTNTSWGVTLNVDGLGAKALRAAPGVDILPGTIIQGTPYAALYNNSDAAWYLQSFYGNPYNVPLAGGLDFWGTTVPNSSFAFPAGQAISRTTYAPLFAIMGTTYGVGDGSTTFNLPDKAGRVSAMKETSSSRLTATYFGGISTNLGATGGSERHALTIVEIPSHAHPITDPGHVHTTSGNFLKQGLVGSDYTGGNFLGSASVLINSATTGISVNNTGGGGAHQNVQPTIICNYIIRIL